MKPILFLLAMCAPCLAQLPNKVVPYAEAKLTLDATNVSSGLKVQNDYVTSWGSYDKTSARERSIELSLKSFSKEPMSVVVRVYWIGRTIYGNERVLLCVDKSTHDLAPSGVTKWNESSGAIVGKDMNLRAINYRRRGGAKVDGFVAVARRASDEAVLAYKTSATYFDKMGADPAELEKLSASGK